jgi:predicted  nucleic acid-binding Zn-ribbon protein
MPRAALMGMIASILGSLATLFGGLRWLLSVYFKQQLKLDAARKQAFTFESELLRGEIEKLKSEIREHKQELIKVSQKTEEAIKALNLNTETQERVFGSFREFVVSVKERFQRLEKEKTLEQVQTGSVVGSVTPPEQPAKASLGKVTLKK